MEPMEIDPVSPRSASGMPYLPAIAVQSIASHLWTGQRAPLFDVMAMCGVCTQWRDICSRIPDHLEVSLTLDCLDGQPVPLSRRAAQFRRASLASQRAFLAGAAKLLHGPGLAGFTLRGPGASDGLVLQVHPWATPTCYTANP